MIRFLLTVGAVVAGLVLANDAALAQKRVALVIGNSAYQNAAKLTNPTRDAASVGELFTKANFDKVLVRNDLGNLEFKRALREFMDAAQDADIAVVYYAGHGVQIRDMNYMIPVDAKLASEVDAEDEAVTLDRIVIALEPAKRLRLVILDACRDNPFMRNMKRRVATRNTSSGLAKMEPTLGDTLIAYAAKAGSTADDGEGANSPFAAALVKHLAEPGLDIRLAFGRVRDEVLKNTGNKQEPFVYGSLGGTSISIVPAAPEPKVQPIADVRGDYELVERIGTRKAWEVFLNTHKSGLYADLARAQLAKLLQEEGANPAPGPLAEPTRDLNTTLAALEPAAPPQPPRPTSEEARAWERIKDTSDQNALRNFIRRYPSSVLALNAQQRLEVLERAAREREEKARAEREAARLRAEEELREKAAEAERLKAERESARQRQEEELRAKAAEAEKQRQEREAARLQRLEEEKRAKATEAERQKLEREAARQRAEEEKRAKAAAKAEQERLAREAARQREEEEKRAKAIEMERRKLEREAALQRAEEEKRAKAAEAERVKAEQAAVEAGRKQQELAALAKPSSETAAKEPMNTPELLRAAQKELARIGCFSGREDGTLGKATVDAITRYHTLRGQPKVDAAVTEGFVAELKDQPRTCPLVCPKGQSAQGEACAVAKPVQSKQAARPAPEKPKAEPKRARTEQPESKKQQAVSRPAPRPTAQPSAAAPRAPMIGVGF